jgi:hypothetical protein
MTPGKTIKKGKSHLKEGKPHSVPKITRHE